MTDFKEGIEHLRRNVAFRTLRDSFAGHFYNVTHVRNRLGREDLYYKWYLGAGGVYLGIDAPKFHAHDAYALKPVKTDVGIFAIRHLPIVWSDSESIPRMTQLVEMTKSAPSDVDAITAEHIAGHATTQVLASVDAHSRVWLPGQESVGEQDLMSFITVSNAVLAARGIPVFEPVKHS